MKTWNTIDKKEWGKGEWQNEPDKASWVDPETEFDCLIVRNRYGALCGYVGVPESHPFFKKEFDTLWGELNVHGSLTFSNLCRDHGDESQDICHPEEGCANKVVWWLGFDCAHCDDLCPSLNGVIFDHQFYRNFEYVKNEVESLAIQLKRAA